MVSWSVLIHRRQREQDFSFFWQSVLRGNSELRKLKLLGTDEFDELAQGILSHTIETQHFLGLEHVKRNVEKILDELNFPRMVRHTIMEDIFGETGLVNAKSLETYDEKVTKLLTKWNEAKKKIKINNECFTRQILDLLYGP